RGVLIVAAPSSSSRPDRRAALIVAAPERRGPEASASTQLEHEHLEVARLRAFERHRMIWSGAAGVEYPRLPAGPRRSRGDDGGEACHGECAGAGAGAPETDGGQLLEGEAVEVAVLLQRGVDLALAAGPLRRVEHDHV